MAGAERRDFKPAVAGSSGTAAIRGVALMSHDRDPRDRFPVRLEHDARDRAGPVELDIEARAGLAGREDDSRQSSGGLATLCEKRVVAGRHSAENEVAVCFTARFLVAGALEVYQRARHRTPRLRHSARKRPHARNLEQHVANTGNRHYKALRL